MSSDDGGSAVVVVRDRRRKRYFQIDNVIVDEYARKIGPHALALYTVLCRRASNDDQSCWVTLRRLGEDVCLKDVRTLRKVIRLLQEFGLIAVTPRFDHATGTQRANEYVLLEPPKEAERIPLHPVQGGASDVPGGGTSHAGGPRASHAGGRGASDAPLKKTPYEKDSREEESRLSPREISDLISFVKDEIGNGWTIESLIDAGRLDAAKWSAVRATSIGRAAMRRVS